MGAVEQIRVILLRLIGQIVMVITVVIAFLVQPKGLVSRVTPVHTAMRNSTRDEGGPFEVDNQVLISSHRKLLWSKAMVVSVAEKPKQDSGRHD
jgi:hypothetical protein